MLILCLALANTNLLSRLKAGNKAILGLVNKAMNSISETSVQRSPRSGELVETLHCIRLPPNDIELGVMSLGSCTCKVFGRKRSAVRKGACHVNSHKPGKKVRKGSLTRNSTAPSDPCLFIHLWN